MPTPQELEARFWKALKSDMTMMLGLDGVEDGHARPMTAQIDDARSPIWFFTVKENAIVQNLGKSNRAIATFTSKGHDLFATVHGRVAWIAIVPPSTGCGTGSLRPGTRAEKTIPDLPCCGSMPSARKSGWTRRACSPGSSCCSAPTPRRNIRTTWPRWR